MILFGFAKLIKSLKVDQLIFYETHGFFGNVVFTCGALLNGDTLQIYYGAADDSIALAEANLNDIFAMAKTG